MSGFALLGSNGVPLVDDQGAPITISQAEQGVNGHSHGQANGSTKRKPGADDDGGSAETAIQIDADKDPEEEVNGKTETNGEQDQEGEEPSVKKRKVEPATVDEDQGGDAGPSKTDAETDKTDGKEKTATRTKGANLNAVEAESAAQTDGAESSDKSEKPSTAAGTDVSSSVPSARVPPPTAATSTDGPDPDADPLQDAPAKPDTAPADDAHLAHPENWTTGDEAATTKQKGFIAVLEKKAGQTGPEGVTGGEGLSKAEASSRIEELKSQT